MSVLRGMGELLGSTYPTGISTTVELQTPGKTHLKTSRSRADVVHFAPLHAILPALQGQILTSHEINSTRKEQDSQRQKNHRHQQQTVVAKNDRKNTRTQGPIRDPQRRRMDADAEEQTTGCVDRCVVAWMRTGGLSLCAWMSKKSRITVRLGAIGPRIFFDLTFWRVKRHLFVEDQERLLPIYTW